jgi:hypothetical protein
MSLLDKLFNSDGEVAQLSKAVEGLAGNVLSLLKTVQNHSQALLALHENQKIILSMVRGRGANVDLPPLFEVKSTKPN